MKTPPRKMTWDSLIEWLRSELKLNYEELDEPEVYDVRCKTCRGSCRPQILAVSIHEPDSDRCAGWGECRQIAVPHCPRCEPEAAPVVYLCTHG